MHRIDIYFLFFTHNEPKLSLGILEVTSICRIHLRTCFEYAVSSETFHGSLWSKQNFPVHYDIDKSNDHNLPGLAGLRKKSKVSDMKIDL